MAVRSFDGTDDQIVLDDGSIGALFNGAFSIVLVAKPLSLNNNDDFYCQAKSNANGTGNNLAGWYQNTAGGTVTYGTDAADTQLSANNVTTDWQVMGVSKASGTTNVRWHRKVMWSGSWTHANSSGTVANVATDMASFVVGSLGGSLYQHMLVATVALYDIELADADWEAMQSESSTQHLADLGAIALWDFNQAATTTPVEDLVGTGDETSLTGTTVVTTDDPPSWTFGLGGGSTPVSATWGLSYNIANSVSRTWALDYDILNAVSRTWALDYDILNAISREYSLSYSILNAVSNEWDLSYEILADAASVSRAWALSYSIINAISREWGLSYSILNAVSRTWALDYGLLNSASREWALSYTVINAASREWALRYNIGEDVQALIAEFISAKRAVWQPDVYSAGRRF